MAKTSPLPGDETLAEEIRRARSRALRRRAEEPFAVRATYDAAHQRLEVELSNGFSFAFPPALFDDLRSASPESLSEIEIDPSGYVLHWPLLDSDYDVNGIVQTALGAKRWLSVSQMGRLGGRVTSEAKRAAAVANGLKGGRPPKRKAEEAGEVSAPRKRRGKEQGKP